MRFYCEGGVFLGGRGRVGHDLGDAVPGEGEGIAVETARECDVG